MRSILKISLGMASFFSVLASAVMIYAAEPIRIKDDVYESFGRDYNYLVSNYGLPDSDTGDGDFFGRMISYSDGLTYVYTPYSDDHEINEISGSAKYIFEGLDSSYDVRDFMNSLEGFYDPTYYVDEGRGDFANYGEGSTVAEIYNEHYSINIVYTDNTIDGDSFVDIWRIRATDQESYDDSSSSDYDTDEISVILNGSKIEFDQAPVNIDGRVMVPIRAIFEAMGYSVDWNSDTHTATATNGNDVILVQTGNEFISFYIDSAAGAYECDVPPQIVSGRVLVPVRAISESSGCSVDWDAYTSTVIIND